MSCGIDIETRDCLRKMPGVAPRVDGEYVCVASK